jgi:nondiscriminating glutamyl-tRNA synthetase
MSTETHKPLKTRFAPSPTGLMHFGNLRTALFNALFAGHHLGNFLLRIEDTDKDRSEDVYREAIQEDLLWLGLHWQEGPYFQSKRQAIYDEKYQQLEKEALVYPCFCSEEQLALTRKVQLASGQTPRYPGTCTHLTAADIQAKKEAGIPFTLRFKVPKGEIIEFVDKVKGLQRFEADHIGDFIIRRGDGSASFMFCNAIDDALMGVDHALRGDDHLTNTPRQILILKALALPIPNYGHFPTILGPDSRPLSKRNGSRSIQELKEEGYLPLAILNYLARLGHHIPDNELGLLDLPGLSKQFKLDNISRAPAHYDEKQLDFWQKEAMLKAPLAECREFLAPFIQKIVPEEKIDSFIQTIQANILKPKEAEFWAEAIFSDGEDMAFPPDIMAVFKDAGQEFFLLASELLKEDSLKEGSASYKNLVEGLQQKTGKKGKAIFFPLRAALTTVLHGPELAKILELIGRKKAMHRLLRAARHASNL